MVTLKLAPARLPPDLRIYAVGDVHGCADRLRAMHAKIAADLLWRPSPNPMVVHLGDYIDRGPDSAGVIDTLLDGWPGETPPRVINLLGNHEEMLLSAMAGADASDANLWLENGGSETLASWGIRHRAAPRDWSQSIPPRHLGFLRGLSLLHRAPGPDGEAGYLFVHAGLRPGLALEHQSRHDLLWIREPFLSSDVVFGPTIVHGHTPSDAPVVRPNRIGVDTGAVLGGLLTCVVLEVDRMDFITA